MSRDCQRGSQGVQAAPHWQPAAWEIIIVARKFWSAAITHFGEEWRAASSLERHGFEFWLPQFIKHSARRKGGRVAAREFVFPGYIFWRVRVGWEIIGSLRGIRRYFVEGEKPARIPDREIQILRATEDEEGLIRLRPRLRAGDRVRVEATEQGSFAGIYQGDEPRARCRVLANLFGKAVSVLVDDEMLRAA